MLIATVLALTAAVLHAGWNLIAKRAVDPFLALWGQFLVAGLLSAPVVVVGTIVGHGLDAAAWGWAAVTGAVHAPYVAALARAYRQGDFSLAYPLARGGGALLAAIGGVTLLDDRLSGWAIGSIVLTVAGMSLLAAGARRDQIAPALLVALTIGVYTTVDSHAARGSGGVLYVFGAFVTTGATVSVVGLLSGRRTALAEVGADAWRRTVVAAAMSVVTYGLVLFAVRRAPVGYVAALRESSVLLAALIGWRVLGERRGTVRAAGAVAIVAGLVLLTTVSTMR